MPTKRPSRPAPGRSLVIPRVSTQEATQRAFDTLKVATTQALKVATTQGNDVAKNAAELTALNTRVATLEGRLINIQVFTANGTYTPTPGATTAIIHLQAPGGGGGGATAGGGVASYAGGGGGGTYLRKRITGLVSGGAVVCPSTGGAGGSVAGGNGSTGGNVSIVVNGTTWTATGGTGGAGSAVLGGPMNGAIGYADSGQPQPGSSAGDIVSAFAGHPGFTVSIAFGGLGMSGRGAGAIMGVGGQVTGNNITPSGAAGFGAGGAGARAVAGQAAGEAGRPGRVEVWEYS